MRLVETKNLIYELTEPALIRSCSNHRTRLWLEMPIVWGTHCTKNDNPWLLTTEKIALKAALRNSARLRLGTTFALCSTLNFLLSFKKAEELESKNFADCKSTSMRNCYAHYFNHLHETIRNHPWLKWLTMSPTEVSCDPFFRVLKKCPKTHIPIVQIVRNPGQMMHANTVHIPLERNKQPGLARSDSPIEPLIIVFRVSDANVSGTVVKESTRFIRIQQLVYQNYITMNCSYTGPKSVAPEFAQLRYSRVRNSQQLGCTGTFAHTAALEIGQSGRNSSIVFFAELHTPDHLPYTMISYIPDSNSAVPASPV